MIANERQYRITKAEAERFEEALAQSDESISDLDPRLRRAMREGLESQLAELREQLAEYEALRAGRVSVLELSSLKELPEALIRARIASGLSQKQLAGRLGIKEQQLPAVGGYPVLRDQPGPDPGGGGGAWSDDSRGSHSSRADRYWLTAVAGLMGDT